MKVYELPFDRATTDNAGDTVIIRRYQAINNSQKNHIVLHRNMINILLSGSKTLYRAEGTATIHSGEILLLATGNCLTTEVKPGDQPFTSILVYFSNDQLTQFFLKQGIQTPATSASQSFIKLTQNDFLQHYARSLDLLLHAQQPLSEALKQIKLEEVLQYLWEQHPTALLQFKANTQGSGDSELIIQQVVENNVGSTITVDEMAFLCNCSLSTFKRRFSKIYNTSPQKWLLERKLQLAAALLQNGENPSRIYILIGYENHSSFSQAFKTRFGATPKAYQQLHHTT
ncbi:AraC-type DNA-binding protein [Filimonas lacunae]|uniref:AraC-type DNA-binding protein n=1 Tax=Filimonas lacunae TaxID=477680 RepID=A0A173M965_9BACT|nr:AraC family transcriptional regulator [Filimonas lacunae]BAV04061.1 transcriptional regulator, AraC family [Filimonas lacunae]SIT15843.1 AraC-type DNA-binding protein [Filimonas lacunae]